jgi:hypothetical protein
VDNIKGNASTLFIQALDSVFDLKGEKEIRRSAAGHIRM